jgi:beta-glucosidase
MTPLDEPVKVDHLDETRIFISTSAPSALTKRWTLKLRGKLLARPKDTSFEFGLISAGRAKVGIELYLYQQIDSHVDGKALCRRRAPDR